MNGYQLIGPLILLFSAGDLILHIMLDVRKMQTSQKGGDATNDVEAPKTVLGVATLVTLLLFFLVFLLSVSWFVPQIDDFLVLIHLIQPGPILDFVGLFLFCGGVLLNGWSRFARKNMASSWEMSDDHTLVTTGPYGWIRHPSYSSYLICIVSVNFLIPSVLSLLLLMGIPAYYSISRYEEELLISQFGDEYHRYMRQTGRFIPHI